MFLFCPCKWPIPIQIRVGTLFCIIANLIKSLSNQCKMYKTPPQGLPLTVGDVQTHLEKMNPEFPTDLKGRSLRRSVMLHTAVLSQPRSVHRCMAAESPSTASPFWGSAPHRQRHPAPTRRRAKRFATWVNSRHSSDLFCSRNAGTLPRNSGTLPFSARNLLTQFYCRPNGDSFGTVLGEQPEKGVHFS